MNEAGLGTQPPRSGKSAFARTLLMAVSGHLHILILDTKGDDVFTGMPDCTIVTQAKNPEVENEKAYDTDLSPRRERTKYLKVDYFETSVRAFVGFAAHHRRCNV
jgi:hypothetical protein